MTIRKAENKAAELLQRFNIKELPIPVREIAQACNVKIQPYDLGEDISGVLVINKGTGTIGYSPVESKVRQRFTIAHELGHYVLHSQSKQEGLFIDKGFKVLFRDYNSSTGEIKHEKEANAFAAALLMPKDLLISKIESLDLDLTDESAIKKLAKMFNVSSISMSFRISNLGLAFY